MLLYLALSGWLWVKLKRFFLWTPLKVISGYILWLKITKSEHKSYSSNLIDHFNLFISSFIDTIFQPHACDCRSFTCFTFKTFCFANFPVVLSSLYFIYVFYHKYEGDCVATIFRTDCGLLSSLWQL